MTQEEKAKAYDEALEKSKRLYEQGTITESLAYIFPELKESEDEKIKNEIIKFLELPHPQFVGKRHQEEWIAWLEKQGTPAKLSEEEQNRFAKGVLTGCAMSFIDYLDAHKYEGKMCVSNGECVDIENAFHNAMWDRLHRYYCKYIEKQGEQKPVWSKEDESIALGIEQLCNCASLLNIAPDKIDKIRTWLKSLKGRILPQPNQEWGEEDNKWIESLIQTFEDGYLEGFNQLKSYGVISWLKSLKERYTWKPSDGQIHAFEQVYDWYNDNFAPSETLTSLYNDLKKLKGE